MASNENHPDNFVRKRGCTNCCFLMLFILFLAGWSVLTFFAFRYGDPEQVFLPTDSKGAICGRGIFKDKPYLFYFNILKCAKFTTITSGCETEMVCVSQCPNFTRSFTEYKSVTKWQEISPEKREEIKANLTCIYEIENQINNNNPIRINEIPNLLDAKKCASIYLKSEPRFGRCIPSDLKKKKKDFLDDENKVIKVSDNETITPKMVVETSRAFAVTFNAQALGELILSDFLTARNFIIYGLIVGAVVSFFWILLMQVMAGVMVWLSMVALIILSGFFSFYSYQRYRFFASRNQTEIDRIEDATLDEILDFDLIDIVKVQFNSWLTSKKLWICFLVISSIIFFLLMVTFIALRKRVRIAIELIKVASKSIMEAKFTLFLPIFPYLLHFLLFLFSVVVALLLLATSKPAYRFESGPQRWQYCDPRDPVNRKVIYDCKKYQLLDDKYVYYVHGYNLFGFFWVWFFIHGVCQMIFAGVFSRYYWTSNKKKNLPTFMILNSTYIAFRYHLGSVALGSFLTATVKIIQVIIEYIDRKCKQYAENPVAKGIIWSMRCCFWVLDKFLRYINTNAYIMIAIYGKGYFSSAKDAFNLILQNILRAMIIDKVADYLLFFGKLAVTLTMGVGTYYAIEHYDKYTFDGKPFPELNYTYKVPIAVITLGTYLIASSFFSVYEMAVNTIFLCFLKDQDQNDGSAEKPYYLPKSLMKILHNSNKSKSSSDSVDSGTGNKVSDSLEL